MGFVCWLLSFQLFTMEYKRFRCQLWLIVERESILANDHRFISKEYISEGMRYFAETKKIKS